MVIKEEQERVRTLLSDTITLLCRNGLTFKSEFNISALIGITLDKDEVFLVDIRETIKNEATVEEEPAEQSDASSTVSTDKKSQKKRKRRRNKSKDKGGGGDSVANSDQEDVEQLHSDGDEPPEKNVKHEDDDNDSEDLVFVKNEPANPAISINNSLQAEQYGSSAMPQAYRDMNSWDAANMSAGLPSTSSNMAAGQPLSLGDVTQISPVNTSSAAAQENTKSEAESAQQNEDDNSEEDAASSETSHETDTLQSVLDQVHSQEICVSIPPPPDQHTPPPQQLPPRESTPDLQLTPATSPVGVVGAPAGGGLSSSVTPIHTPPPLTSASEVVAPMTPPTTSLPPLSFSSPTSTLSHTPPPPQPPTSTKELSPVATAATPMGLSHAVVSSSSAASLLYSSPPPQQQPQQHKSTVNFSMSNNTSNHTQPTLSNQYQSQSCSQVSPKTMSSGSGGVSSMPSSSSTTGDDRGEYKCHLCDKQYTRKRNLTRHVKTTHENLMTRCKYCSKYILNMDKHMVRVHRDKLPRDLPPHLDAALNKTFLPAAAAPANKKKKLKKAKSIGQAAVSPKSIEEVEDMNFECGLCGATFYGKDAIAAHMAEHMRRGNGQQQPVGPVQWAGEVAVPPPPPPDCMMMTSQASGQYLGDSGQVMATPEHHMQQQQQQHQVIASSQAQQIGMSLSQPMASQMQMMSSMMPPHHHHSTTAMLSPNLLSETMSAGQMFESRTQQTRHMIQMVSSQTSAMLVTGPPPGPGPHHHHHYQTPPQSSHHMIQGNMMHSPPPQTANMGGMVSPSPMLHSPPPPGGVMGGDHGVMWGPGQHTQPQPQTQPAPVPTKHHHSQQQQHSKKSHSSHKKGSREDGPFWCELCQKEYTRRDTYIRHMRVKHNTTATKYMCSAVPKCKRSFLSRDQLAQHVRREHGTGTSGEHKQAYHQQHASKSSSKSRSGGSSSHHHHHTSATHTNSTTSGGNSKKVKVACDFCERTYSCRKNMRVHMKQAHPTEYAMSLDPARASLLHKQHKPPLNLDRTGLPDNERATLQKIFGAGGMKHVNEDDDSATAYSVSNKEDGGNGGVGKDKDDGCRDLEHLNTGDLMALPQGELEELSRGDLGLSVSALHSLTGTDKQ